MAAVDFAAVETNGDVASNIETCVDHLFVAQARRTPAATAVVFEDREREALTYAELDRRTSQLARQLRRLGVGPDIPVAVHMERSIETVVALLGVLKAGGVYVPLDPSYPAERLAFMLADTAAPVLLTQPRLRGALAPAAAHVVALDPSWSAIAAEDGLPVAAGTPPDSLAYIIYTSGSTGQPKGVMVPHRALSNQLLWRRQAYGFTAADRLLQVLPLGFDPSLWELLAPLVTGGRLVLARQGGHQDGRYLADLISRQRITVLEVVPRLLRLLLDEPGFDSCNALRRVFCGGEVLTAELCDRFFARSAAALANVYGPTEATIVATCWECVRPTSEPAPRRAVVSNGGEHGNMGAGVPIGRAIPNTRALLLDERGQPTPPGETGELYLGGAGLARGYLNRPDLTAERFVLLPADGRADGAQRLYRTGDLARSLPDGSFVFLGRVDDQVKIRGFRVEPAEVEAVLAAHPGVRECAVIARRDARGDHRLVAYVCERGAALGAPHASGSLVAGARALRDYLLARLPEHMVPSAFVAMDALPLTPSGKLDTHALPDPAVAPPAVGAGSLAPRDGVEAQLAAIWRDILQVPAVGVRDDFFALGGDSLQVMALVAEIETQLGRALLGSAIYETRTIERLARLLQADPDASPLVAVQPEGTWPPLFLVGAGHGDLPGFYRLASYLGADQPLFALQPPAKTEEYAAYTSLPLLAAAYIEQVRLVQGEGPYVLAGYSAGGIVAFEMAQQLRAQRAEVVAVVILDSQFPVPFGADYLLFRGLRRVAGALAWRGLWRTGSQIQQMLADPGFEVTFRALCGYRPRRYVGTVALLLAERSYVRRSPTPWQWRRVAPELATHVVPGGHFSALHEPHVVALAQRVRAVLDAAVHS